VGVANGGASGTLVFHAMLPRLWIRAEVLWGDITAGTTAGVETPWKKKSSEAAVRSSCRMSLRQAATWQVRLREPPVASLGKRGLHRRQYTAAMDAN
jgi:hypothetical protein